MVATNSNFSPAIIRRYVYELVLLIIILSVLTAGYIFWATNKSNSTLEQINKYHHHSQLQLLKATDTVYEMQILLSSKNTQWQELDQQQTEFNILLYRLHQTLDYAQQLQDRYADNQFKTLNILLLNQSDTLFNTVDEFKEDIYTADSIFADSEALLITIKKLSRLHTVVHNERLAKLHEQNRLQNILFYTILIILFIIAALATLRGLKVINNIIIQHQKSELELHQAQKDAQEQLRIHNQELETTVTERTQELLDAQDQLLRKNRLSTLGQITGIVSHELRNPLGTISATLYSLRKKLDQQQSGHDRLLDRIARSVQRCDHIVEELLIYSRNRDMNLDTIDFDTWLNSLLDEHTLPVAVKVQRDIHAQVQSAIDTEHMRSAITNLLDNASQSMANEDGTARDDACLSVRTIQQDGKLICEIEDNGIGMTPDVLEKIFEPLFTTKVYGVGFGMTIVERTVEQHGGELEINSVQNEGTLCRISLDVVKD